MNKKHRIKLKHRKVNCDSNTILEIMYTVENIHVTKINATPNSN